MPEAADDHSVRIQIPGNGDDLTPDPAPAQSAPGPWAASGAASLPAEPGS